MAESLHIGSHEDLTVIRADSEVFEVEAAYLPHGNPPPPHIHPDQDEHFAILDGVLHVDLGGQARDLSAGDELTIPRRQVHRMWNQGGQPVRARWRTTLALTTEQWFRGLADLQRQAEQRGRTRADVLGFAVHAHRHRATFRLVVGGSPVIGTAVTDLLALAGRAAGRGPRT